MSNERQKENDQIFASAMVSSQEQPVAKKTYIYRKEVDDIIEKFKAKKKYYEEFKYYRDQYELTKDNEKLPDISKFEEELRKSVRKFVLNGEVFFMDILTHMRNIEK